MIPFASQRGLGQDLATHLYNTQDNEYMEVAEVRGAIAQDLHGAFAEWEAQAHALTKCQNYLYSLSVNPDDRQGQLTREQYFDYIERAEERLGLVGQPRAVIFHIKEGREHCHVVWSRVDAWNEKALHLAYDHDKLMMVTREFARDHELELPKGYFKDKGAEKTPQLTLYEQTQQARTGLGKADHIEAVTDAWRASDNALAFVQALADKGYMLATGKRPYVLVDFYGGMHALPRMIDDKSVRAKHIQAFLAKDYPTDSLPSVEEARALIADHRKTAEAHLKSEQRAVALAQLKQKQAQRRQEVEKENQRLWLKQHGEMRDLDKRQKRDRKKLRSAHVRHGGQIRQKRDAKRPTGFAAKVARVLGLSAIRRTFNRVQDHKRTRAYLEKKDELQLRQLQERNQLQRRHEMNSLDMQRKLRALNKVEKREVMSLEQSQRQEVRIRARGGRSKMPSLTLELTPPGRKAVPYKAKNRYRSGFVEEKFKKAQEPEQKKKLVDLQGDFERAAGDGNADSGKTGSSDGPMPKKQPKRRRFNYDRRGDRDNDRER